MRTLPACAFVAVTALTTACGGGGEAQPDAAIVIVDAAPDAFVPPPDAFVQPPDLSCMGNPAPTTAPATITLSGTVQNFNILANSLEPVPDASVKATKNPAIPIGPQNVMSDMQGNWTLADLPTADVPIDGFITALKGTFHTIRVYPPQPLNSDQANIPVPLLSNTTFGFIAGGQDPQNGTIALVVTDCAGNPLDGATVTAKQDGSAVGDAPQDLGQFAPGTFFILNVPPGDTEVSATVQGTEFRAHVVGVAADTTSATVVNPGFLN